MNATIHGAVVRANQLKVEVFGLIKGFNSLFNPRVPYVHLNPLYQEIPEIDPTKGGTMIGSSRDFVDPEKKAGIDVVTSHLERLGIEGLICVGGDGTLNGLQPLAELEKASGKEPEDWNIECCLCECSLDFVNFTERYRGPKNLAGVVVSASCQGRIRPRLRRWLWPSERNQTSCPGALHRVARKRLDA
jgi:6-phosphofructokinase